MIFNWISRCWGGMGISTQFQKARINCSIADWTVPFQDDVLLLITSFQGKNPQIAAKTAVNVFLSHLQTDQQKAHPAFLLKHLYVLDHCIEQMTALDTIGYYYNSNLTASKSHKTIELNESKSPLRQLINTYYSLLITKARTFGHYERTYFSNDLRPMQTSVFGGSAHKIHTQMQDDYQIPTQLMANSSNFDIMSSSGHKRRQRECTKQQRVIYELFQKQSSYNSIFDVIQKCQQLQKLISQMNKAYQAGNRKVELIRYIFIMCLWTYIRCYIIVSVGIRFLFRHFISMSLKELQRFVKTFLHFNNEYTSEFIRFVQSNKTDIDVFKEINYNQLTYVNKDALRVLLDYKEEIKSKEDIKSRTSKKVVETSLPQVTLNENGALNPTLSGEMRQMRILELPHNVHTHIKENMKIFYKPRKNMDFCLQQHANKKVTDPDSYQDQFQEDRMEESFFNYESFYHESFSTEADDLPIELKKNKSNGSNSALKITSSLLKGSSQVQRKSRISKQLTPNLIEPKNTEQRTINFVDDPKIKLTTSQILESHAANRSTLPIKPAEMTEIKEMFHHRRKASRKYSNWEEWENVYGDVVEMKN